MDDDLASGVQAGDRRSLARGITLIESRHPDQREQAVALLAALPAPSAEATRVAISGPPGVGKSSFIEALGVHLVGAGHRVAVLAVDPSSTLSGGSILGDKTRMERLAREPNAYIRPSPAAGALGGVARRTREAMLLCEAAGFDVVIVETVGVGQSEVEVDGMVDTFVLLLSPGGGDELQGIKRGVMELADVVVVTKADGDLQAAANRAAADSDHALHLLRPRMAGWSPPVLLTSAVEDRGIDDVWRAVLEHRDASLASGTFAERRAAQALQWMWSEVREEMQRELLADPGVAAEAEALTEAVRAGTTTPIAAARALLARRPR